MVENPSQPITCLVSALLLSRPMKTQLNPWEPMRTHLVLEDTLWTNHVLEEVFPDVGVDGGERVVKEIDVSVLVDGASERDALLLPPGEVDTLGREKGM